jgi:hypothetical protein
MMPFQLTLRQWPYGVSMFLLTHRSVGARP